MLDRRNLLLLMLGGGVVPLGRAVAQPAPPPHGAPPHGAPPPARRPAVRPHMPPMRHEVPPPRPRGNYRWRFVPGHWYWNGYRWVWIRGRWAR